MDTAHKKISLNLSSRLVLLFFGVMLVWWGFINLNNLENTPNNFIYGAALGVLPIAAALLSLINIKRWGGFKSSMGRALTFLAAGLFTWGVGTLIFAYYNLFLNVEVPYPSFADVAYIISWPLWTIAMITMFRVTGAKAQLRKFGGRITLFLIPLITIVLSYYLLIVVAREGSVISSDELWKTFFDIAYPLGDIVLLTITALVFSLSLNYLGGFFKWPIFLVLAGFVFNYIADFAFVFLTTKGTYFVADWVDLTYTTAFFLLGFGLTLMDPKLISKES